MADYFRLFLLENFCKFGASDVDSMKPDAGRNIRALSGGQVIDHADFVTLRKKGLDDMRPNKTGASRNQDLHSSESVVGDIRVELPQESHALVETSTAGELTTDYSTEISWQGLKKVGSTRIGDGEARIILRSQNGNIQLIRKKMH